MRTVDKSDEDPLLRSTTIQTISHWIKYIRKESDVDTSIFQTRSCRMVSTSKASQNGLSIENIMEMADWSNSRTFNKFYFRTEVKNDFADKVLRW
jgi:hypothetical protein